jgi:dipeptidyl aminopeptidase/acylaminoacyl peptidase
MRRRLAIRRSRKATLAAVGLILVFSPGSLRGQQNAATETYIVAPEPVQDLFRRDKNITTLDALSPDGDHFVIPLFQELTDLKLMSQKTYRLANLELCPDVNREWRLSTYGNYGLKLYSLARNETSPVQLPPNAFVSHMQWSPDGRRIAFLAHLPSMTQVWVAEVDSGRAQAVSDAPVMATLAARPGGGAAETPGASATHMLQWLPDGSLLTLLVPAGRGPEPAASALPRGPLVRTTRDKPTPTSTEVFLLRTPHDQDLFRYYTTAQLAVVAPGRSPRPIGRPAMYMDFSLSPDGKYILRETLNEPFSYLVTFNSFGRRLEVMDLDGKVLGEIRRTPLQEAQSRGGDRADDDLPREVEWRPDGKGLSFLLKEEKPKDDAADARPRRDRLMLLAPPFDMTRAQSLASSEHAMSAVSYAKDGRYAFLTLTRRPPEGGKRREAIVAYDLTTPPAAELRLTQDVDPEDPLTLPGRVLTTRSGNGVEWAVQPADESAVYLTGDGFKANFRPQPFVDRVAIRGGAATRLFEGSSETFDRPLVPLDVDLSKMVVSRESRTMVPDSYLWTRGGGLSKLTANVDPYPEITAAKRVDFEFTRRDGLKVQGRISLPVGYQPGTRVPAVFWTYPREFGSPEEYARGAIRARNQNAYTPLSFLRWSDIWLTQGYALVYPDIPIIGKNNTFNDNYLAHLTDTIYAAIRKVDELGYVDIDRIGHGGHSYGAFTTANLLAHTPFFKAGIAGDGAYNRSLTPMTFQGERRLIWDAPETYLEMSPFFYADHINTPLLMYHGEKDNNSGTFIIQSERMLQALTGLGKNAVLYIYPYESHAPRAKENFLDLWARWLDWFDRYVKQPAAGRKPTSSRKP